MRVLSYHGVLDKSATDETSLSYLFTDITDFDEQVRLLKRRAQLVSLAEIEAGLSGKEPLPEHAVHVSFDDGYRNNLDAAEILDRHAVPWSLFAVVDAVLDGYQPWFLRFANAIWATPRVTVPDGTVVELDAIWQKRRFAKDAKAEIMSMPGGDQDGAVDHLLSLPGMRVPSESAWPLLTLPELRQLHASGVEIGNHSARHRNLGLCTDEALHAEVVLSRARLEEALGSPVRYFAYPDGRHGPRVRRVVGSSHALALATWTLGPAKRRLALRRYESHGVSELNAILDNPEPSYGRRWARWTLPWRARELAMRARISRRQLLLTDARRK